MMLAACDEGISDRARTGEALGLGADEARAIVLSFGYPTRPRDPGTRSPHEWITRADRKPLEEVVRFV
jgi:hypothetical protein